MKTIYTKKVWTSSGWLYNARVDIQNNKILNITKNQVSDEAVPILIPGMIELHAHGSLGYNASFADANENEAWLKRLASRGVTGILPTLSSSPPEKICNAVAFYNGIMKNPIENGARVLGVHLEGPFINFEKKGGINGDYITNPSVEHYEMLTGEHKNAVKQITMAPELDGAEVLIKHLKQNGVFVNAGHSNATADQMRDAIACGVDGVTHFFNAAKPITHRDPGFLTAAMLDKNVFCEIVCDLVHLAPEIICLMVQAVGAQRLVAVTDAVTLTGMPDGQYGKNIVVDGSPRLENGTLTGGRYLMDDCARSLIGIGIDPWDVFCMTSYTPAKRIGLTDMGDIAVGFTANLVALDDDYNVIYTLIN